MDCSTVLWYLSQVRNLLRNLLKPDIYICEFPHSQPRNICAMSACCLCLVYSILVPRPVNAPTCVSGYETMNVCGWYMLCLRNVRVLSAAYPHAIYGSCKMYTLVQVGRQPMIHKSLSVVAKWNTPSNFQLTNCSHREGRVQVRYQVSGIRHSYLTWETISQWLL